MSWTLPTALLPVAGAVAFWPLVAGIAAVWVGWVLLWLLEQWW